MNTLDKDRGTRGSVARVALASVGLLTVLALGLVGCTEESGGGTGGSGGGAGGAGGSTPDPNDLTLLTQVLVTNADIALATYSDSIDELQNLKTALQALVDTPNDTTLAEARRAWLQANEPYGFTEVYRFRNSPIDGDDLGEIELQINSWPLGEALIDYVTEGTDFGPDQVGVTAQDTGVTDPIPDNNIINSTDIDITEDLLSRGISAEDERDVIAGYHAIEFLLWGQDTNAGGDADSLGNRDQTPGERPASDYIVGVGCTSGTGVTSDQEICERRGEYLIVAVDKLIADVTAVRDEWADDGSSNFRAAFTNPADLDEAKNRLCEILTGMGTMAEGELAGERMQIALTTDSQEDEHSCFSDNTHRDIVGNAEGIYGMYLGEYPGYEDAPLDGTIDNTDRAVDGYGINDYLTEIGLTALESATTAAFEATRVSYTALNAQVVDDGQPIDNIIADASSEDAANMRSTIELLNAEAQDLVDIALELQLECDVIQDDASECDTSDPTTEC